MKHDITITNGIDLLTRNIHYALEDNAMAVFKKSSVRRWVTYRQYLYLKAVYLNPNISQKELSVILHNTSNAVGRMTLKLKNKKYISITEDESDRKKNVIKLTSAGRKVVLTGFNVIKAGLVKKLEGLTAQEYNAYTKIATNILRLLK